MNKYIIMTFIFSLFLLSCSEKNNEIKTPIEYTNPINDKLVNAVDIVGNSNRIRNLPIIYNVLFEKEGDSIFVGISKGIFPLEIFPEDKLEFGYIEYGTAFIVCAYDSTIAGIVNNFIDTSQLNANIQSLVPDASEIRGLTIDFKVYKFYVNELNELVFIGKGYW